MPYENMAGAITQPSVDNHHALLFVGVCNYERYVRSLIRWTNLLHDMYGYRLGNIRILVGTYADASWPSMVAGTDVTYGATMTDLDNALAGYATGGADPHALGANDNLFIFTFNHGGNDGDGLGSYLCCDSFSNNYYASSFAARIGVIHCRQIVLLAAQCMAGGFVDPVINALWTGTRGAVMAGSRSDQTTYEAVCDKLFASAFNGRIVQDVVDDNIDLGITGDGIGVNLIPGYHTNRIDWGPTGVLSTREAFNFVHDHICAIRSSYPAITEIPLYSQKPWNEAGQPLHIRLGEPDLVMQDDATDTGVEPSAGTPWSSPDLYADNTDQFPVAGQHQYVPAHDNRFFVRTANRGTAPTDGVFRCLEVRGLGFTGGPVGPPRIDRASETSGAITASARLRPGRAHTQYERILIGGDFGHGCVSAAAWCGVDAMDHAQWDIQSDNDQVQCNLDPAAVSGSTSAGSGSTNSNAGKIIRTIPVFAAEEGTFELRLDRAEPDLPLEIVPDKQRMTLRKGQTGEFRIEISVKPGTKDGLKGRVALAIHRERVVVGGVTVLISVGTAAAAVHVHDHRGLPTFDARVVLWHPGDPRKLQAPTDSKGVARFGPLNPGFYFAHTKGSDQSPVRLFAAVGETATVKLTVDRSGRRQFLALPEKIEAGILG